MHMSFGAVFFYFLHGLRWLQIYRKCRKQKKKPSIRRRNEINDTSARRQPTHKTKSEDKSKLLLTTYVFSGLIDVLFANVFILFRAIKESDARMWFASLSIRTWKIENDNLRFN